MALRDTLRSITEPTHDDGEFEARKPQLIADWQASVRRLNTQFRDWLSEYEAEQKVRFQTEETMLREDDLGAYQVETMSIHAGPFVVRVQPAGRLIVGAIGRVDMYRQGRLAPDERVLFLRSENAQGESWKLRRPLSRGGSNFDLQPLERQTFETALDELLI